MSKYNIYAKMLDKEFRVAREAYKEAFERLQTAQDADRKAGKWFAESYKGEREAKKARAHLALLAEQDSFRAVKNKIWEEFDAKVKTIRSELLAVIKQDNLASPASVDNNGMELLKSGILTADDFEGLASRYDANPTMLRLISRYAKEAADKVEDKTERARLFEVHNATRDGYGKIVRAWDELEVIAKYCSGRGGSGMRNPEPAHVVKMGEFWDSLGVKNVENF